MKATHWLLALYGPIAVAVLLAIYILAFVILPETRALVNEVRAERKTDSMLESARQHAIDQAVEIRREQDLTLKRLRQEREKQ